MDKNVLIALALLCAGQGYGSDQLSEKKNTEAPGKLEILRRGYHVGRHATKAVLLGVGGATLTCAVAPGIFGHSCLQNMVAEFYYWGVGATGLPEVVAGSSFVGLVRGVLQVRTDCENDEKLRELKIAEEKKRHTQGLTDTSRYQELLQKTELSTVQDPMSHRISILAKKPANSLLTDEEFLSEYCRRLMLAYQNDKNEEDHKNATTSSSALSSSKRFSTESYPAHGDTK